MRQKDRQHFRTQDEGTKDPCISRGAHIQPERFSRATCLQYLLMLRGEISSNVWKVALEFGYKHLGMHPHPCVKHG